MDWIDYFISLLNRLPETPAFILFLRMGKIGMVVVSIFIAFYRVLVSPKTDHIWQMVKLG